MRRDNNDSLIDEGTYTITVTGKGAYSGSASFTCAVVDVDSTLKCDPDDNSWYVNMPTPGEVKLSNVSKLSSFKVYDDGGKNGDYSENCDGTLVINVPEDYMLSLSGTVSSESLSDCLYVYDGSSASVTKLVEISETEPTSITAKSSGTSLTLCFMSDSMIQKAGLDLTVTISKCNSLVFDANGGSGSMKNIYFRDSTAKPLTENTFTREGYTFLGWNTKADGTGTSYEDKAEFSLSDAEAGATITLCARWIEIVTLTAKADPYTKGAYYTTFYDSSVNYAVDKDTEAYYVDDNENGVRFYRVTGEITIGAHKAWIERYAVH